MVVQHTDAIMDKHASTQFHLNRLNAVLSLGSAEHLTTWLDSPSQHKGSPTSCHSQA